MACVRGDSFQLSNATTGGDIEFPLFTLFRIHQQRSRVYAQLKFYQLTCSCCLEFTGSL